MSPALRRTFAFAGTTFVVLLLANLAVWGGFQGMHPRNELPSQLLIHAAVHASVLVLSITGAVAGFALLRQRLPSAKVASAFGAVFAILSFYAIVVAFTAAGFWGVTAWLLVGSAAIALLSGLTARRNES